MDSDDEEEMKKKNKNLRLVNWQNLLSSLIFLALFLSSQKKKRQINEQIPQKKFEMVISDDDETENKENAPKKANKEEAKKEIKEEKPPSQTNISIGSNATTNAVINTNNDNKLPNKSQPPAEKKKTQSNTLATNKIQKKNYYYYKFFFFFLTEYLVKTPNDYFAKFNDKTKSNDANKGTEDVDKSKKTVSVPAESVAIKNADEATPNISQTKKTKSPQKEQEKEKKKEKEKEKEIKKEEPKGTLFKINTATDKKTVCDAPVTTQESNEEDLEIISTVTNPIVKTEVKTNSDKKKGGKKRKLSAISGTPEQTEEKPTKKPRVYHPYQRSDNPPLHGQKDVPEGQPNCLSGKRFVITGQLPSLTREECQDIILKYGGFCEGSGESKLESAKGKKVEVIDEDKFFELLKSLPAQRAPSATSKKTKTPQKLSKSATCTTDMPSITPMANAVPTPMANTVTPMPSLISDVPTQLLVDAYKPQTSKDLIGNSSGLSKLRTFLLSWNINYNQDKDNFTRACLVDGPPGIGKTSAVHVIARECGFDIIELNASDTRSKNLLNATLKESLNSHSMHDFYKEKVTKEGEMVIGKSVGKVLVMDEVDGMSTGDRGGIVELIKFIATTRMPIICICNSLEKLKTLQKHCESVHFTAPAQQQICSRLSQIAQQIGFSVSMSTIMKLANESHGDIRQMLHSLQFWSNQPESDSTSVAQKLDFDQAENEMKKLHKDVTKTYLDVLPKFFLPSTSIADGLDYFFVDYFFLPLTMFETYAYIPSSKRLSVENLNVMAEAVCFLTINIRI
ncbi:replication factor C large subunit [Reticulomyxa filosa]|uniref:Replication factor C large subunit n=1 Tax=Reticulomyxa filosa TaxID=46433 RepID=X6LXX6_RETFI|nr:replication factor C large subunit [Reticulomyxa filosa]|eukprot:ETO05997.1 replication factor C large subunit [Reticulomyxa filosa]